MNIDFKGPTGLIFDVSALNWMLDMEGHYSPLARQFVIERDLVEKLGLSVVSSIPQCVSLKQQYKEIRTLLSHYNLDFHTRLPDYIVDMLKSFVISVVMDNEILLISLQKPLPRS